MEWFVCRKDKKKEIEDGWNLWRKTILNVKRGRNRRLWMKGKEKYKLDVFKGKEGKDKEVLEDK